MLKTAMLFAVGAFALVAIFQQWVTGDVKYKSCVQRAVLGYEQYKSDHPEPGVPTFAAAQIFEQRRLQDESDIEKIKLLCSTAQ